MKKRLILCYGYSINNNIISISIIHSVFGQFRHTLHSLLFVYCIATLKGII